MSRGLKEHLAEPAKEQRRPLGPARRAESSSQAQALLASSHSTSSTFVGSFLTLFLPIWLLVGVVLFAVHHIDFGRQYSAIRTDEGRRIAAAKEVLASQVRFVVSDLITLRGILESWIDDADSVPGGVSSLGDELLSFLRTKSAYDHVRLIDSTGQEVLRVNREGGIPKLVPEDRLQSKSDRYYFRQTVSLPPGSLYISRFDLNIENAEIERPFKPTVRVATPFSLPGTDEPGVLILNYLGSHLLSELARVTDSPHGQVMLLDPEGYWLGGGEQAGEWGFMFEGGDQRTFGGSYAEVWQLISDAEQGQEDFASGLFTFERLHPLAGLESITSIRTGQDEGLLPSEAYAWILVSRFTRAELEALYLASLRPYGYLFATLGVLLAVLCICLTRISHARRLDQAELRLKSKALAATANSVMITDAKGTILWVNPAFTRLTGYSPDEAIGQPPRILRSDKHDPQFYEGLWSAIAAGVGWRDEIVNRRKDGSFYDADLIITPLVGEREEPTHFIAVKIDITHRKKTEKALRYRLELDDLVSNISTRFIEMKADEIDRGIEQALAEIGSFLGAERAHIQYHHQDLTRLDVTHLWRSLSVGLSKEKLQAVDATQMPWLSARVARFEPVALSDLEELPPEAEAERRMLESQGLRSAVIVPMESRPDGRFFLGLSCRRQREWTATDIKALEMVGQVITHALRRKDDELELVRARDRAEASNRAKSVFLANMSHEIRTPMNAILGFSQIIEEDEALTPEHRERASLILTSGRTLLHLLDDVLEMARIEAGRVHAELGPVDLHELLAGLDSMFRDRAEAKALRWRLECSETVPRHVITDGTKLRIVLGHLLDNALKFTDSGEVMLRFEIREERGRARRLAVLVRDTGQGIAGEDQEKIFEAFERVENRLETTGSSGLGLAIGLRYARLLKGDLQVESSPGNGSTFTLEIPVDTLAVPQEKLPGGSLLLELEQRLDHPPDDDLSERAVRLPADLVRELKEAAISGRLERLHRLIEQVALLDQELAFGLDDLLSCFDYEALIEILDESRPGDPVRVPGETP